MENYVTYHKADAWHLDITEVVHLIIYYQFSAN